MPSGRKPGYEMSDETKEKICASMKGKPKSNAHKQAMSEAQKTRTAEGRNCLCRGKTAKE
jgi:NUMOD3 motif